MATKFQEAVQNDVSGKAIQRLSSSYVQSAGHKIMEKIKADVLQLPVEKAPKGKPKGKGWGWGVGGRSEKG